MFSCWKKKSGDGEKIRDENFILNFPQTSYMKCLWKLKPSQRKSTKKTVKLFQLVVTFTRRINYSFMAAKKRFVFKSISVDIYDVFITCFLSFHFKFYSTTMSNVLWELVYKYTYRNSFLSVFFYVVKWICLVYLVKKYKY